MDWKIITSTAASFSSAFYFHLAARQREKKSDQMSPSGCSDHENKTKNALINKFC